MPVISVPYHLDEPLSDLPGNGISVTAALPDAAQPQRLVVLYREVARVVAESISTRLGDRRPPVVVVSGDCTASLGVLAGLQRAGVDPSVVWFDAHGDFNTPATTESGYIGGMPLAMIVGHDDLGIAGGAGLASIDETRVLLVDARDLDPRERSLLARSAVRRSKVIDVDSTEMPAGPLYLHLDCDVVDAGQAPGLRYPVPDGPSVAEVAAAIHHVLATGRVVAVGLACTWTAAGLAEGQMSRTLDQLGLSELLR